MKHHVSPWWMSPVAVAMLVAGLESTACKGSDADTAPSSGGSAGSTAKGGAGPKAGAGGSVSGSSGRPSMGGGGGSQAGMGSSEAGDGSAGDSGPSGGGSGGSTGGSAGKSSASGGTSADVPVTDVQPAVVTRLASGNFGIAGPMYTQGTPYPTGFGVAEVTLSGETKWTRKILENPCTEPPDLYCPFADQIQASASGSVFLTGRTPVPLPDEKQTSSLDYFALAVDDSGELAWGRQIGARVTVQRWLAGTDVAGSLRDYTLAPTESSAVGVGQLNRYDTKGKTAWQVELDGLSDSDAGELDSYWDADTDADGTTYVLVERNLYTNTPHGDDYLDVWSLDDKGKALPKVTIASRSAADFPGVKDGTAWSIKVTADGSALYIVAQDALFKVDEHDKIVFRKELPKPKGKLAFSRWNLLLAPDGSSVYLFDQGGGGDGMTIMRYATDDGEQAWTKEVPSPAAPGPSSVTVDADNEYLVIVFGSLGAGLAAMPTSGKEDPVPFVTSVF